MIITGYFYRGENDTIKNLNYDIQPNYIVETSTTKMKDEYFRWHLRYIFLNILYDQELMISTTKKMRHKIMYIFIKL